MPIEDLAGGFLYFNGARYFLKSLHTNFAAISKKTDML